MIARGLPLAGLLQETTREIKDVLVPREWKANSILFREGEYCSGLHLVESGIVKLYTASGSGREQIVHLVSDPGPITLTPLFERNDYASSAAALTDARTLFMPRAEFERFFHTYSDFAYAVTCELARRVRATIRIAETIALKQVPSRVAARIMENARLHGALESRQSFRMTLNQEELARLLGTSRESVARAFSDLRRAGVIDQRGSRVRILNPPALARWIKGKRHREDLCAASQTVQTAVASIASRGEGATPHPFN